jgi:hypothetical protein
MKLRRKEKQGRLKSPCCWTRSRRYGRRKKKNLRVERENIKGAPEYGRRGELQTQFVEMANTRSTLSFASLLLPSQAQWSWVDSMPK